MPSASAVNVVRRQIAILTILVRVGPELIVAVDAADVLVAVALALVLRRPPEVDLVAALAHELFAEVPLQGHAVPRA